MTGAQRALAALEEARRKAEDEANRLADDRVSLLLELKVSKDELIVVWAEAFKEKKAMEEAFDTGFEVIFIYDLVWLMPRGALCLLPRAFLIRFPSREANRRSFSCCRWSAQLCNSSICLACSSCFASISWR